MCDRWRQVAGQRKVDLASARLVGASRSDFPGRHAATLSEPTFRKLFPQCLLPVKNVATALGFMVVLKSRPVSVHPDSVRLPMFARGSQPNSGLEARRVMRSLFLWRSTSRCFEQCFPLSNIPIVAAANETQDDPESPNELLSPVVMGVSPCDRVPATDFLVFRTGRNRVEFGPFSAARRLPTARSLAHAPDWVQVDLTDSERNLSSSSQSNAPAGTSPMPAKGFVLHEKRDAHQCPPTGGEPDCHC